MAGSTLLKIDEDINPLGLAPVRGRGCSYKTLNFEALLTHPWVAG